MKDDLEQRARVQAPGARLGKPVRWALAGTLVATAASMIWPARELVPAQERTNAGPPRHAPAASAAAVTRVADVAAASAPRGDGALAARVATFDPFIGVVPPPPPPPPPVVQQAVVAAPPAPPAQDYRFLGRVTGPDGSDQVLLIRADVPTPVAVGTTLDNGYVVESISDDTIMLTYPKLGTKVAIPVGADRNMH